MIKLNLYNNTLFVVSLMYRLMIGGFIMPYTKEQILLAKQQGFLPLKDKEHFACRVVIPAGVMTRAYAEKILAIADFYGRGYYTHTQRLDVEIPWVHYEDIENITASLAEVGLEPGGTGQRIRPILTCKGSVCRVGLFDTEKIALEMHERFYKGYYNTVLPNKMAITLSGCFNMCSRAPLAAIGLIGKKKDLVAVVIGGTYSRTQAIGRELKGLYTLDTALTIVERGIQFYIAHGKEGERFSTMVERIGFEHVEAFMLGESMVL